MAQSKRSKHAQEASLDETASLSTRMKRRHQLNNSIDFTSMAATNLGNNRDIFECP